MLEIKNIEQVTNQMFKVRDDVYRISYNKSIRCVETISDKGAEWVECYVFDISRKDDDYVSFTNIGFLKVNRESVTNGDIISANVAFAPYVTDNHNLKSIQGKIIISSLDRFIQHLSWLFENRILPIDTSSLTKQILTQTKSW